MTIVVGLKHNGGVTLACDTQAVAGYNAVQRLDSKIFEAHGIGYGFTTSYRMGQILKYHSLQVLSDLRETDLYGYIVLYLVPMWRSALKEGGFTRNIGSGEEAGGSFLVAIDGRLFNIEDDFQVSERLDQYSVVGCGGEYALGALRILTSAENTPEDVVNKAVESAIYFSIGCGGRIDTLTI